VSFPPPTSQLTTAYVDDQLLATGKISKGAIIGKQGGIWAASGGYNVRLRPTSASSSVGHHIRPTARNAGITWESGLTCSCPRRSRTPSPTRSSRSQMRREVGAASIDAGPGGCQLRAALTPANGVTLAGFKFMTIKAEPDEVVGRKGVSGRG